MATRNEKSKAEAVAQGVWSQIEAFAGEVMRTSKIERPKRRQKKQQPEPTLENPRPNPHLRQMDIFDILPQDYHPLLALPACPCP
jgi:hypothetical protein